MTSLNLIWTAIVIEVAALLCLLFLIVLTAVRNRGAKKRRLRREWNGLMPDALCARREATARMQRGLRSDSNLRIFQRYLDDLIKESDSAPSAQLRHLCRALGVTDWLRHQVKCSKDQLDSACAARTLSALRERPDREHMDTLLCSSDPAVVLSIGYASAATRDPSVFLRVFRAVYERTPITLHGAAELLSRFGPGVCPVILDLIEHVNHQYRLPFDAAGRSPEDAVRTDDVAAQVVMIDLLAFFAYVPASRSLGELLNHSQYDEVLIHLVKALAKVGGRHAVPRLTEMLGHRNWVVRAQAATTLAALRATESASEVTALLEDGDIRVRVAAQRSVRRLQAINRPPVDRPLEVVA